MRHSPVAGATYFFTTSPLPCPYFSDRVERRVVTEVLGRDASVLHEALTHAGFRRSHSIAYAPTCPECDACVSVRVLADRFRPSRTQRRIFNRNAHLTAHITAPSATEEQFALFAAYQSDRHAGGDMANMDGDDYRALIEESNVDTHLVEFRDDGERLVAGCLVDELSDGFSAVYSFFDPELDSGASLGTYMILWLIDRAREMELPHVYLGFWIDGCRKMSYKASFRPLETYTADGWKSFDPSGA